MFSVFEYFCYVGVVLTPWLYPKITVAGVVIGVIFNSIFLMTVVAYVRVSESHITIAIRSYNSFICESRFVHITIASIIMQVMIVM